MELTWEDQRSFFSPTRRVREPPEAPITTPPPFPIANSASRGFFVPISPRRVERLFQVLRRLETTREHNPGINTFDGYYLIGQAVLPQARADAEPLIFNSGLYRIDIRLRRKDVCAATELLLRRTLGSSCIDEGFNNSRSNVGFNIFLA